jgi:hypothetical protein
MVSRRRESQRRLASPHSTGSPTPLLPHRPSRRLPHSRQGRLQRCPVLDLRQQRLAHGFFEEVAGGDLAVLGAGTAGGEEGQEVPLVAGEKNAAGGGADEGREGGGGVAAEGFGEGAVGPAVLEAEGDDVFPSQVEVAGGGGDGGDGAVVDGLADGGLVDAEEEGDFGGGVGGAGGEEELAEVSPVGRGAAALWHPVRVPF